MANVDSEPRNVSPAAELRGCRQANPGIGGRFWATKVSLGWNISGERCA